MAFKLDSRCRESFSTAGTGNITTLGAVGNGSSAFNSFLSTGDTTWYFAVKGTQWESGLLTFTSPTTIARTQIFDNSSGGTSAIDFDPGSGEIFCDIPSHVLDALNLVEISVTSAATCDIGTVQGKRIVISGTTGPITSFGTQPNKLRIVRHSGSTLTHNATSLILLGGISRLTAANDIGMYVSDASGNWREIAYEYASPVVFFPNQAFTGSIAVGDGLRALSHASAEQGYYNTSVGINALNDLTSGWYNTAVGANAMQWATTSYGNVAVGYNSLAANTTGIDNVAVGVNALLNCDVGQDNTALGINALRETSGDENTAVGVDALWNNTTGNRNSALGGLAGRLITGGAPKQTGNESIYIGYLSQSAADGQNNEIVIGSNAVGQGTNKVVLGHTTITDTYLRGIIHVDGQVSFPATLNASADANTLDDYEEGTYTPSYTAVSGTITSYTSTGWYTKVGDLWSVGANVIVTDAGTGDGVAIGLPATSAVISSLFGRETQNTGKALNGEIASSSATSSVRYYDNANPNVTGNRLRINCQFK